MPVEELFQVLVKVPVEVLVKMPGEVLVEVLVYIGGRPEKVPAKGYLTLGIPGRFNDTGEQFKNLNEHMLFSWLWATNFFPVETAECEHINGKPIDNRRSNVPLRPKMENNGNREVGTRRRS